MGEKPDSADLLAKIRDAALHEGFGLERKAAKVLVESGYLPELGTSYLDLEEDEQGLHHWRDCDVRALLNEAFEPDLRSQLIVVGECKYVPPKYTWAFVVDPVPELNGPLGPFVTTSDNDGIACEPSMGIAESKDYFVGHPHFAHQQRSKQHFVFPKPSDSNAPSKIRDAWLQAVKPAWYELHQRAFGTRLYRERLFVVSYIVVSNQIAAVTYTPGFDDVTVEFRDSVLLTFERPIAHVQSLRDRIQNSLGNSSKTSLGGPVDLMRMQRAARDRQRLQWLSQHRRSFVEVVTLKGLAESSQALRKWFLRVGSIVPAPDTA